MEKKNRYKFSLRKKLAIFITILATITYSTSAFCLYILYPSIDSSIHLSPLVFNIITLLLGIFWSGFLGFLAAGFITRPLQKLERGAMQAAHGNISMDVEISKSDDEVKSLGLAFNHMLYNLREMVQSIETNFNDTNETVKTISEEADRAMEHSLAIASSVKEIAGGAEVSAQSVQASSESVEESMRIAQMVEEKAHNSRTVSIDMTKKLADSNKVVQSLVEGMREMVAENHQSLLSVNHLENHSKEIEDVLKLVGEIASQTNLLALNASIEAARAGEHGAGFSVVAEEVRRLADESGKAVEGISEIIKNMQAEVKNVVSQIGKQVESAQHKAEVGEETSIVFREMNKTVEEMAKATIDITELIHQQKQQIYDTLQQSQEVAAISEETAAGTQQVTHITENQTDLIKKVDRLALKLKTNAEHLQQTICRFKI
ncbi:methyl-accepting chemotaxis protein [Bacillus sp. B1-b2]|uniref:methyl-accepting chemotaxis protein n=1 Tax=Bacillus sp. B1-b2 TaxID=2653201 RepID=UPI0012622C69|nr:methyl-accepting chemotaxis protein [Bacillus sp. B1-b2]KAB7671836.1 methyl-accepting chemotaxis protein [Bacillus sp. B1-b2]